MDVKRCFKVLEIKETDSLDEIKQAYRDLISIWHPDRYVQNPRLQEKATEKVKELNSAYNYLVSHTSQIMMTDGSEKKPGKDPLQPIVVICPKCQAMNRFQADMWVWQRKCIYCNFKLLSENTAFNQRQERSEKKTGPNGNVRKKKQSGFRWVLLFTVGCMGLFYLVAPHVRMLFFTNTEDRSEAKHAAQSIDTFTGKDRIVEIQRFLSLLAYDPGPVDGMLGNKTLNALDQFKVDFSIQPKEADHHVVMHALERHVRIAKLHPEWPAIFKGKDFNDWIEAQTITAPESCKQVIATGSVLQVASLVDFYKFDRIDPDPVSLPPSGVIHKNYVKGLAPMTIQARNDGRHYYAKLIREDDRSEAFSAFLRSGFTMTEHVPVGKYRLKYAVGKTWYGFKWFFGSETVFHSVDQVFDFKFQGNEIKGYRLNLYLVPLSSSQGRRSYAFDF
jgi:hypothetical protein